MRHPLLSVEAIDYQNTLVFDELTLVFKGIMLQNKAEYEQERVRNTSLIKTILNNAFGCSVSVVFTERYPSMRIFDEYHNSVLVANDSRQAYAQSMQFVQRFLNNKKNGVKGGVDIKKAKLSGIFTELPFSIYLPEEHLMSGYQRSDGIRLPERLRFTPAEMAAMVLHEMGHFFTYCEFFNRTVTTNQALAQLSKELDDCYSVSQRETVITTACNAIGLKNFDAASLATTDKKTIIETALVTETVELSRSELGVSIYDQTASEFLADQFASRCGAGRELMNALAKYQDIFGKDLAFHSTPLYLIKQMFSILLCLNPFTGWFAIPVNLIIIYFGGLGDSHGNVYDAPEARFRRLRADAVNRLKNRYLSEQEKKAMLDDVAAFDEMLTRVKDKSDWREFIANNLIPKYRQHRQSKQLQQELEALANNPLFVRSAELSTLS